MLKDESVAAVKSGKRINLAHFMTNDDVLLGIQIRRSIEASCLGGDDNIF